MEIYDLIAVGAGPCGIAAILEAQNAGMKKVALLEKAEFSNQTIRAFYKDGKRVDTNYKGIPAVFKGCVSFEDGVKESTLEYFDKLISDSGCEFQNWCEVDRVLKDGENFKVVTPKGDMIAKNVVIGIGKMGKPNKPRYKIPSSLTQRVNFNLDKCTGGESILVVGGGDSAVEYAIGVADGNEVTLCYRKPTFTRLNDTNLADINAAKESGKVNVRMPLDITGLEDDGGRVKVLYEDGTSTTYDRVIYAIGGTTPVDFLKKCGINLDENGIPVCDPATHESNIAGLYVGGDLLTKNGASIAVAISDAFDIVSHIKGK